MHERRTDLHERPTDRTFTDRSGALTGAEMAGVRVTAADELPHLDAFGAGGSELWENHGWCVRAAADDHEFLLWIAFYIVRGALSGRFTVGDVRVAQAIVVHGEFPPSERTGMRDTPFSASGVHWSEYRGAEELEVVEQDGTVVWSLDGREHVSAPPHWRVVGRCGDLEVELDFAGRSPASWFDGFDLINGYEVLADVSGTIATPSETWTISGIAQHEKVHTQHPIQRRDRAGWLTLPVGERHLWHFGGARELAFSMLANQPGEEPDRLNGQIVVPDGVRHFGREHLTVEETETWVDPRSGVVIPTAWRIGVALPAGELELNVRAYARAYYLWDYLRGSTSLLYWLLADAQARWRPANGTAPQAERLAYVAHTNRPFLYWGITTGKRGAS